MAPRKVTAAFTGKGGRHSWRHLEARSSPVHRDWGRSLGTPIDPGMLNHKELLRSFKNCLFTLFTSREPGAALRRCIVGAIVICRTGGGQTDTRGSM